VKSPEAPDYNAIKRRIRDDMAKGKTRFIIDIGPHQLDAGLLSSLTRYKTVRRISRLVVMSDNGKTLTEV
jgi:hypothetical protein